MLCRTRDLAPSLFSPVGDGPSSESMFCSPKRNDQNVNYGMKRRCLQICSHNGFNEHAHVQTLPFHPRIQLLEMIRAVSFTLTAPRPDAEGEDGRAEGARRRHETHLKLAEAVAHHAVVTFNFIALLSET